MIQIAKKVVSRKEFLKLSGTGLAGAALLGTAGCGGPSSQDDQGTINWDYVTFVGPTHPFTVYSSQKFADEVEEATNGRLVITVRPAGELPYSPTDYLKVIQRNQVQMADAAFGFVGGDSKMADLPGLPFLATDSEVDKAMSVVEPYLQEDFARFNATMFYWYNVLGQSVWGQGERIESPEDFEGRKMRSISPQLGDFTRRVGGSPVTMVTEEVGPALERGTIDGTYSAAQNIDASKWGEFLDWNYKLNTGAGLIYVVANQEALDSLPDDVRQALEEVVQEMQPGIQQALLKENRESEERLEQELGIEFYEPTPQETQQYTELMEPYWDEWARENGEETEEAMKEVRAALGK